MSSTEPLTPPDVPSECDIVPVDPVAATPPDGSLNEAGAEPATEPATEVSAAPAQRDMSPADCARELKARFPALFVGAPKPLKLRIQADIQARAPGVFTKKALSIFLHRYTGATSYLMALSRASQRFDLDGQPVAELADEHRLAAGEELKRRRGAHEERQALEEEQRRNRAQLLRDFETTTLTRANFCVLKAVADGELDGLLEIARTERAEWAARRPAAPERRERQDPRGGAPRSNERPAGRDRRPRPQR
jgi:ProP effector